MPSIESNRKTFEAAKENGSIIPAVPIDTPKPIPVATYPVAPNPNLRTPLPAISIQQPDIQRQWQTGATPQQRILPPSQTGNPIVAAQTISHIIVQDSASVTPITDIESIAINKQTGTAYTVQVSDLDTLITCSNNSGGTITLPGPAGPIFAFKQIVQGTFSSVLTIAITPARGSLLIMQVKNDSGGGNVQPSIVDGNGNTWHYIASGADGGNLATNFYYSYNVNAGLDSVQLTSFYGTGVALEGFILEYSGFGATDPLDTSALSGSQPIITTGKPNCLVYSGIASVVNIGATAGPGFTSRYSNGQIICQDQFVAVSGTSVTGDCTPTAVGHAPVNFIASFKTSTGPSSINFPPGWFTYIENTGTGTFAITAPTTNIDGSATNVSLPPNSGALLVFDGTNWFTERGISVALPVSAANGGTGRATLTAHAVLLGEGTSPVNFAAPGTTGLPLASNGAAADPSFQTISAAVGLSNGVTGSGAVVLAGSPTITGTAALPVVTTSGKITNYNGIATVSEGVPAEYATIDITNQNANQGVSTLYTTPSSGGAGMYRVSAYVVLTTVDAVSSTLPNVQIVFTDQNTNTTVTMDATPVLAGAGMGQTAALTNNTVGTAVSGVIAISVGGGTVIQYQTAGYASNTPGTMKYAMHLKLEAL